MYRNAFKIVGDLVKLNIAEAVFEDVDDTSVHKNLAYEHITQPKFKLVSHTGKKSFNERFEFGGETVLE